ncbi:DUF2493 domain-containing protein [Maribacter luteus]|uniref:DUF2493 domain-containing protein n=1 Tax=Maribacter luteus TaxID=2594478 RepID=UPI002493CAA4|nr:DUF2493 domain-containing protein [Maribacter luteus]
MQDIIKLIIAGGRDFNDYDMIKNEANKFISELNPTAVIIVSGGAKGVDALGEKYARDNNFDIEIFKADWSKYGRAAGPKRNKSMAQFASHLLAFWNGESKGTKSMISLAKRENLIIKVCSI